MREKLGIKMEHSNGALTPLDPAPMLAAWGDDANSSPDHLRLYHDVRRAW